MGSHGSSTGWALLLLLWLHPKRLHLRQALQTGRVHIQIKVWIWHRAMLLWWGTGAWKEARRKLSSNFTIYFQVFPILPTPQFLLILTWDYPQHTDTHTRTCTSTHTCAHTGHSISHFSSVPALCPVPSLRILFFLWGFGACSMSFPISDLGQHCF